MKNKNKAKRHWLVLIICCGLIASSIGICVNVVGVFYTPVSEGLGVLKGTVAMQSTIAMISMSLATLGVPKLIDKWGIRQTIIMGVFATALTTGLMAFTNNIFIFYLLGAFRGVAVALFGFTPVTTIINNWFHEKHGFAMSVALSFTGIAGAVFSPVLTFCIDSFGWRNAHLVMGIMIIALCLPAILFRFTFKPQEDGYLPYGFVEEVKQSGEQSGESSLKYARSILAAILAFALLINLVAQITQHLPGFSESLGHGSQVGAMMLSLGMLGNILAKLVMGSLCDRLGVAKVTISLVLMNTFSLLLLTVNPSSMTLLIAAFLFGSVFGVSSVGVALLTRYFFGKDNYVKIYPVISFAAGVGGAFALTIVGYIYDFTSSYHAAFYTGATFNLLSICLLCLAIKIKKKT